MTTSDLTTVLHLLGPGTTVALLLLLMLFIGVVLPGVWSRHAYRRTAAHRILNTLLQALKYLRRP